MAAEETKTESKRRPDISQSELQVAFEFKLENYYQQGNDADKKVAEGILIDELRSFVANFGSEKTLTDALARARETVSGKNEISEARFNLIAGRIQGLYKDMVAEAREESRKKMHDSMRDYSDLLSDETVRRARNPEDQKRKEDMEKAAADALRDFMRRGGDEKAIRETLADIPGVTPHFERRFTALAKMQAAFVNYGETLREHGPSTKKESMAAKQEAEKALIQSLRSFAKAGGSPERMEEVLKEIYAEYGTKLEGQGSMTDWFVKKIKDLYAQEVAKEEERKKQQQQQSVDDKTQDDKTQDDKTQDDKTQDDKTQDDKTQDDKTQEPVLDVGMEEDVSGHTKTQEGTEGIDWAKAFDLAKTYADEEKKNAFPKPTKIVANSYDNSGAELESGARISVNPTNPNSVTLHTTREQAHRPGAYLEDCMTFMKASAEKGYKSINIRNGNEAFVRAMYQAAVMQGFDPAKVNLPEEYKHMAQEWALEANEMKGGKIPETYKRDGQEQTGDEKTGVEPPAPAAKTTETKKAGGKTSGTKEAGEKTAETKETAKPLTAEDLAKKAEAEKAARAAFNDLVFAVQEKGVASARDSKEAKKFEKAMQAYASYMSPEDVAAFKKSLDDKTPKVDEEHIAAYSHAKKLAFAITEEAYKNRQPPKTKEPKKAEKEPVAPPTPEQVKEAEANAQKAFKAIVQDQHAPEATSKKEQQAHMDAFFEAMKVAVYGKSEEELKQFQTNMQKAGMAYESKEGLREGAAKNAVGLITARMQGASDYLQKRAKLDEKGKIAQFMGKVQDGLKFKKERAVIESNPLVAKKISEAKGR